MNTKCSGCGSANVQKTTLTRDLLISPTPELAPDIFPLTINYCIDCGYVKGAFIPSGTDHDGYFTYKTFHDNVYPPHYHKSGWHFEFVTKGSFDYYQRPVGSTDPAVKTTISAGQLFFSPATIEHGFLFKDKTGLISIVNKGRPTDDFTVVVGDFYPKTQ